MARHYYLTRSGRLRRKDNTLYFEPSATEDAPVEEQSVDVLRGQETPHVDEDGVTGDPSSAIGVNLADDGLGDLALEPEALSVEATLGETVATEGNAAE